MAGVRGIFLSAGEHTTGEPTPLVHRHCSKSETPCAVPPLARVFSGVRGLMVAQG